MKHPIFKMLTISIIILLITLPLKSQVVNRKDASIVAKNWIRMIIENKKNWGGNEQAEIKDIWDLRRNGGRLLGYYCAVEPSGFIVISLNKVLAPVKAYSETDNLDPTSEEGPVDLIKDKMEGILDQVEMRVGDIESAKIEDIVKVLEIDYRSAWQEMEDDRISLNYQEGDVMLSTHWHQSAPFNDQCPYMDCDNLNGRAIVGCTATAGSQLTRYWCWPPYRGNSSDPYDWPNMKYQYIWDPATKFWKDEYGNALMPAQVDPVAKLCHEMGVSVGMDYGCDASSAPICRWYETDMRDALEDDFRYHTGDCEDRDDYSATDWFNLLKNEFNKNKPVLYHVTNHSIVSDGWQEIGSTPTRQYHMNYGWSVSDNIWYTLDSLPLGDEDEEYALLNIHPVQALGPSLTGTYARDSFPYRYFNEDATCSDVTFAAGQYLQMLPGLKISCTSGILEFKATVSNPTYLFWDGDISNGIQIHNGSIQVKQNAGINFQK